MQNSGDLQNQRVSLGQAVELHRAVKNLTGQTGDILRMHLVGAVPLSDIFYRGDDILIIVMFDLYLVCLKRIIHHASVAEVRVADVDGVCLGLLQKLLVNDNGWQCHPRIFDGHAILHGKILIRCFFDLLENVADFLVV